MKKTVSSGSCIILFEDNDNFAGKEVFMEGERISKGFCISPESISWLVFNEDRGMRQTKEIDDDMKEALLEYIIAEGAKQGFTFDMFVTPNTGCN